MTVEVKAKEHEGCEQQAIHALEVSRRSFFGVLLGSGSLMIGAIVGTPLFRFVLYPVYASGRKSEWSEVCDADEIAGASGPVVKTVALAERDGWRDVVSSHSVIVNRGADGKLNVLSSVCPHLGCSVAWHENKQRFICPCHGGQFAANGDRISGPPPRGLDRLDAQVKDGKLQVRFEFFKSNVADREQMS